MWKKRGRWSGKKEKKRKTMLQEKKGHNSEIHGLKKEEKGLHVFVWWSVNRVFPSTLLILSFSLTRHTHIHTLHTHCFCVCSYKERQLAFQPGSTGDV